MCRIDGVWYHYCAHGTNGDFVGDIQEQCRSFVWHFFQTEDYIGHFDVVHAHDWLASNAMVWIKEGRPDHGAILITILEAWAAGKPVVASQNGGPAVFVWHTVNGLKIYPTVESVDRGLGTLFTNFEWARWMGHNGRVAAETAFTWDRIAALTLDCYRS